MSEETLHHEAGPSSLANIEICPSWESRGGTNPVAEEGSMLHHVLETGEGLDDLDDNQLRMVRCARALVEPILETAKRVKLEQRLTISHEGQELTFGTADVVAIQEDGSADLIDYKFGFAYVDDPSINIQGVAYALGLLQAEPDVNEVRVSFYMARYDEVLGPVTFTRGDEANMLIRVKTILDRRAANPPIYNRNPKACLYCGKLATCPANLESMLPLAKKYADKAPDLDLVGLDVGAITDVVSEEGLGRLYRFNEVLTNMTAAITQHINRMGLEEGVVPEGLDIGTKNARRSIKDAQKALDIVLGEFGVDYRTLLANLNLSPTALDKAVTSSVPKGSGADAVRRLNSSLIQAGAMDDPSEKPVRYLKKIRSKH